MSTPHDLFIDGVFRPGATGERFDLIDPATEQVIDTVATAAAQDLEDALRAAAAGFELWRATDAWTRSGVLRRAAALVLERREVIAATMTEEQGKPLAEAVAELTATADQLDWYADEARRIYGRTVEGHSTQVRMSVIRQPVGVVAAFSAWNFPALLPMRKVAPALAAGCAIIVKPAEEAPRTMLHLAQALADAGLPAGVLNVVMGDPKTISAHLIRSNIVRKVSLTGSVPVGREVLRACAEDIKDVSMELGGHAPVLVFADADVQRAAEVAVLAKFRNAGQVCISPSRFFVQESIVDELTERMVTLVSKLKIGPGAEPGTTVGPLSNRRRLERVQALVADALDGGAQLAAGGRSPEGFNQGFFFEPTVLTEVTSDMLIMDEEPFGPVAPIVAFSDLEDGLRQANATPYGLAGYVFTRDLATAHLASEGLEVGMVGVNNLVIATAEAPFGGIKQSGFGREGGSEGVESYTYRKYVNVLL